MTVMIDQKTMTMKPAVTQKMKDKNIVIIASSTLPGEDYVESGCGSLKHVFGAMTAKYNGIYIGGTSRTASENVAGIEKCKKEGIEIAKKYD